MAKKKARKKKSAKKKTTRKKKSTKKAARKKSSKKKSAKKKSAKKKASKKKPARSTAGSVDDYIQTLDGWQKDAVKRLRRLVKQAAPSVDEAIKWAQPVFSDNGPAVWIKAFKNHVSMGFWRGLELSDPRGLLESNGQKMAHLKIKGLPEINAREIQRLVRQAVKLNRDQGDPSR